MARHTQIIVIILLILSIFVCLPQMEVADNTIDGDKLLLYPLMVWACVIIVLYISWDRLLMMAPAKKVAVFLISISSLVVAQAITISINYKFATNSEPAYVDAVVLNTQKHLGRYKRNVAIIEVYGKPREFTIWAGFSRLSPGDKVVLFECEGMLGFKYFINKALYRAEVKNRDCKSFF